MKYKTYTFSLAVKHDKIVNIITGYDGMQGKKMNRSAVVQRAIEMYAESYLPTDVYNNMLAMIKDLDEEEEEEEKE